MALSGDIGHLRSPSGAPDSKSTDPFPAKTDFDIPPGLTYLNSAYIHPMPIASVRAIHDYCALRSRIQVPSPAENDVDPKSEFAALINAKASEISYVPNTSTAENLVVNGLGIPQSGGNVVTDALHFEGAILHLQQLQQDHGLDLQIVMPREGSIDLHDLERVVNKHTRLIEVSLVSMYNGFQHDLKAVCDLAHAHGAYVYADIVQAVGTTPIDVRTSVVDFCACSSFKWLMGDFGLGFLYVKEELLDRVIHRSQSGYFQAKRIDTHFLPGDPSASAPITFELGTGATAHFEVGTNATAVARSLGQSLPYIRRLDPQRIEAWRQPLLQRLREEMPRLGFQPITPPDSKSALISFTVKDAQAVRDRLRKAQVHALVMRNYIRLSPSVFNDLHDVDNLLNALS